VTFNLKLHVRNVTVIWVLVVVTVALDDSEAAPSRIISLDDQLELQVERKLELDHWHARLKGASATASGSGGHASDASDIMPSTSS
jgi:hypothetical protein